MCVSVCLSRDICNKEGERERDAERRFQPNTHTTRKRDRLMNELHMEVRSTLGRIRRGKDMIRESVVEEMERRERERKTETFKCNHTRNNILGISLSLSLSVSCNTKYSATTTSGITDTDKMIIISLNHILACNL